MKNDNPVKTVYLDYAATTPIDPRVLKSMSPYLKTKFGNSMSIHQYGQDAGEAVENSRKIIAGMINARETEIVFTGSATESNNLVLKGIAFANNHRGKHIIISPIEHDCILESARWLEKQGFEITVLPVDKYGFVDLQVLEKNIRKDTILVSVIHASNEIGTIQDIEKIGKICKDKRVYFHTDASQSFGKLPIDVNKMNIDLLTASSHKIYGPKGAALLFVRGSVIIDPLLHGGGHESGLRSSTVNVPAIVGFAEAAKIAMEEMDQENTRLTILRDKLINRILSTVDNTNLNGHPTKRLCNNVNISFSFIEGETLAMQLDMMDIAVSTGSACSSKNLEPSHVLTALGLPPQKAHGSIRMSLGRWTKTSDINYVLKVLPGIVEKYRSMSPFKR